VTTANLPHFTRCGLPGLNRVPVGMHACHFYNNRDQLVAALVPYCVEELRGNERCLWITAPPMPAREAVEAVRAAYDGVDDAVQVDALRILDFDQWYASPAGLKGLNLVQLWLEEEERALAEGYNGLRIAGNTSFLTPGDWSTFMEYEQAVTASFNGQRIVALCSYARAQCNYQQMSEFMHAHHCALEVRTPTGKWSRFLSFLGALEANLRRRS
jgi:two-component system, sensor histidine kinase PdtaS